MQKEIWKDLPNYIGLYMVSNLGRVKSLKRQVVNNRGFRIIPEKILNPGIDSTGYYRLSLSKDSNVETLRVHVLVAICFHNHISNYGKIVVDHIDENKLNNNSKNLQIITLVQNLKKSRLIKKLRYEIR